VEKVHSTFYTSHDYVKFLWAEKKMTSY